MIMFLLFQSFFNIDQINVEAVSESVQARDTNFTLKMSFVAFSPMPLSQASQINLNVRGILKSHLSYDRPVLTNFVCRQFVSALKRFIIFLKL